MSIIKNERREREDAKNNEDEHDSLLVLTEFQSKCKNILIDEMNYPRIEDGKTFGSHLHCYRNAIKSATNDHQNDDKCDVVFVESNAPDQEHQHGETLVLCVENSKRERLSSDLRYLSVASRIANTTRKRFFVAFDENKKKDIDQEDSEKKKPAMRMIEFISIT